MLFFIPKPVRRLIYLAVLLGLLSVADIAVKVWAEGQIEARAEDRLSHVGGVDVSIGGFPFVGRLLAFGEIDQLTVRLDEVAHQQLTFASAGLSLNGIAIDRGRMLSSREVELEGLDSGTASAEITADQLSQVVGVQVELRPGVAAVHAGGQVVQASVTVRDGQVVLLPQGGGPLALAVPTDELLPCVGQVTVLTGRLRVTCSLEHIPAPLVRAASRAANQLS